MKKILSLTLLFLFFSQPLWGAPPTRTQTYTTGEVISSSEVTENEDNIFNYLQAGVDTYSPLSIENADVSATANIQSDKLNLTSIAQAVGITSGGSLTNAGTLTQSGAITITGNSTFAGTTIADLGTVTTADINAGTWAGTVDGNWDATGQTASDLGTVTTIDINGGTLDGVQIGGTTATGELIVNNATDDADGLGAQGTTGQVLTSAGAGSNPTWTDQGLRFISATTATTASTTGNIDVDDEALYRVIVVGEMTNATSTHINLNFNNGDTTATAYSFNVSYSALHTTPSTGQIGDDSHSAINLVHTTITNESSFRFAFDLETFTGTDGIDATVYGRGYYEDDTSNKNWNTDFAGTFDNAADPTNFAITTQNNMASVTVYLYKYGLN